MPSFDLIRHSDNVEVRGVKRTLEVIYLKFLNSLRRILVNLPFCIFLEFKYRVKGLYAVNL